MKTEASSKDQRPTLRLLSLKNILIILVLGVFAYILLNTDFKRIWFHIREVPLPVLSLLFFLQLVTQFSLNFQWYRLCKAMKMKTSFSRLLVINAYGMIADAMTPGEKVGGEVARVVQLKGMLKYSTYQSTSLVTIQKSISLTALILLCMAAVVTLSGEIAFLRSPAIRVVLMIALLSLAIFFLFLLFFTGKVNGLVQKLPCSGKAASWFKSWMQSFTRDTKEIGKRPRQWIFQLLLSLGIWGLFPLKLFILVSQNAKVNLLVLFAITFVSYFAAMIPLLPGGLGTFEGTMSGTLLLYGLTPEQSLAVSLVFRFVTFWFVVLFSAAIIIVWKIFQIRRKNRCEGQ